MTINLKSEEYVCVCVAFTGNNGFCLIFEHRVRAQRKWSNIIIIQRLMQVNWRDWVLMATERLPFLQSSDKGNCACEQRNRTHSGGTSCGVVTPLCIHKMYFFFFFFLLRLLQCFVYIIHCLLFVIVYNYKGT